MYLKKIIGKLKEILKATIQHVIFKKNLKQKIKVIQNVYTFETNTCDMATTAATSYVPPLTQHHVRTSSPPPSLNGKHTWTIQTQI